MLTRLAELLEAWDLDPRHPIALFVSGSSEILPEVPDPLEAEGLRERVEDLEADLDEAEARADEAEARVAGLEAEVESLRAQVALLCEGDPTGRLAAEARAETDRVRALLDQIALSAKNAEGYLARKGARKEFALRSLQWIQSAAKGG